MHRAIVAISLASLVLALVFLQVTRSAAQGVPPSACAATVGSSIEYLPCPTATPTVPAFTTPTKDMAVAPANSPAPGTLAYTVTITSKLACFALDEPIALTALGSPGATMLTSLGPVLSQSQGNWIPSVLVDATPGTQSAGTAQVLLEILQRQVGAGGVTLKAEWPQEGVERDQVLIPPQTPTPGGVPPFVPSATPVPSVTQTPTAVPTPTATPSPTAGPITVQAAVDPAILAGHSLGGATPTLCAKAPPGATCYPTVRYLPGGSSPIDEGYQRAHLLGGDANASGIVEFQWNEDSTGTSGVAGVDCMVGQNHGRACAGFVLLQQTNPPPSAADQAALLRQAQTFATQHCRVFP